jgi:small subunit ribosomal protein S21
MGTAVELRDGESFDSMFRRFRKGVMKARTLKEVKKRRFFVSKSEQRRRAKRKAAARARRQQRKRERGYRS